MMESFFYLSTCDQFMWIWFVFLTYRLTKQRDQLIFINCCVHSNINRLVGFHVQTSFFVWILLKFGNDGQSFGQSKYITDKFCNLIKVPICWNELVYKLRTQPNQLLAIHAVWCASFLAYRLLQSRFQLHLPRYSNASIPRSPKVISNLLHQLTFTWNQKEKT